MIRTIITPKQQTVSLEIPRDYVGKQIEVIVFAKDEVTFEEGIFGKNVSFDALSIDTRNYKFDREEANER
ncbi:hypothetical protein L0657_26295 [Dyadobacter sp. CY345]|uniref:hypothetical protein n=1 Tax=Dyadobacter sp. CY345 TaxID=2909335 RepID=UPI001F48CF14|nr:hypothetical protein [Dyadobacter sp. CY345]MCF2447493.1 hypothetical protein [Dyadobacter sp. CY345]